MTLTADGSLISADTLVAETKETLENNASILGNTVVLKGNDMVNLGSILGKDITLKAERDVIQKGLITGEDRAALAAGRDISMGNTILHGKNQDILDTTAGIAVKGKEGVLLMEAGRDIHLTGATLEALGDKGSMILKAGKDLILDTDSLQAKDVDSDTLDFNGTGDLGNAIGKMDVTMHAERQESGWHISIFGGNVYDFDEHSYDNLIIDIANNLAWKEEIEGRMIPYPWYVRIECDI